MKNFIDYEPKTPYPSKPASLDYNKMKSTLGDAFSRKIADIEAIHKTDMENYASSMQEYRDERAQLTAEFESDLLEEFNLSQHPKANKIYAYAYEKGHAEGFSGIYNVMSDIFDLF